MSNVRVAMHANIDLSGVQALARRIKNAEKRIVKVGIPDDATEADGKTSCAFIGRVHEFGSPEAGIPERPFLRGALNSRDVQQKHARLNEKSLRNVLNGSETVDGALEKYGNAAAGDVKQYIRNGTFAALSDLTIAAKGSSAPLIDTGQMRQSITFVVGDKQ